MKHTTLCYIEKGGKYLMIHRTKKKNDENVDKWIGLGGKLEPGEDPFDCVRREVLEESGLIIESPRYRGFITFVSNEFGTEYMHLFSANDFTGALKDDCDEGELVFIDKKELLNLNLWEGDKIFLKLLDSDTPFFSLKLVYDKDTLTSHKLEY